MCFLFKSSFVPTCTQSFSRLSGRETGIHLSTFSSSGPVSSIPSAIICSRVGSAPPCTSPGAGGLREEAVMQGAPGLPWAGGVLTPAALRHANNLGTDECELCGPARDARARPVQLERHGAARIMMKLPSPCSMRPLVSVESHEIHGVSSESLDEVFSGLTINR